MPRVSAGLLMYRIQDCELQVLLAHPGGPFFRNKDEGAWTIPKGEIEPGEELLEAAKREFQEETGVTPRKNEDQKTTATEATLVIKAMPYPQS